MKTYHVRIEQDEGWFCAQCLEEPGVITEARNLDELVWMLRDAIALFNDEPKTVPVQLELIIPPSSEGTEPPRELFDDEPIEQVTAAADEGRSYRSAE